MTHTRIQFCWNGSAHAEFASAVSLHSHTLHSRESLDFIHRATKNTPLLSGMIRKENSRFRELNGRDLEFNRAWWTPPLSPRQAFELEKRQIEAELGKRAIVSISDHDNINAGLQLHVCEAMRDCPVSVEWTVPFRHTFFHLGIHNIPPDSATSMMRAMEQLTAIPREERIVELLAWFAGYPEVLIVFNHPMWDEMHIGAALHQEQVHQFLGVCGPYVHAMELNGLRPWSENQDCIRLARLRDVPVVSGGDRHGREPNACLNLTNAANFVEFAHEVRTDGKSHVLFMPQYRQPLRVRVLENICDILADDPNHGMGWVRWCDRVFYQTEDGAEMPVGTLWGEKMPSCVKWFHGFVSVLSHRPVRSALKLALHGRETFAMP